MTAQRLFLKPVIKGAIVRDPQDGSLLPDDGAEKPATPYWRRLLHTGDVQHCSSAERATKSTKPLLAVKPKE